MELTLEIIEDGSGRTEERTVDVEPGDVLSDILNTADINPQTVLIERNGTIITHRDTVQADDERIRILDVISGG